MDKNKNQHIYSANLGDIVQKDNLVAFIDESGDDCFDTEKVGVSKWFNVSAVVTKPIIADQMLQYVENFNHKPLKNMSSKDLSHTQRKDLFSGLTKFSYKTIHSVFYKPEIGQAYKMNLYPNMYLIGLQNVIERITWCTKQFKRKLVNIFISSRNKVREEQIKNYIFNPSFRNSSSLYYPERIGAVNYLKTEEEFKLLFADYSAFTLNSAIENRGNPACPDPQYFKWFQKGHLYSSTHPKYGGVWGNGLKLVPDYSNIIEQNEILQEIKKIK